MIYMNERITLLRKENYLITPGTNTNLGECFYLPNGDLALKIKKPNKNAYETIPFKQLERMAAESAKKYAM